MSHQVNAFGETLAVYDYCKNDTAHVYALYGQNSEFVELNLVVHMLTTKLQRVSSIT